MNRMLLQVFIFHFFALLFLLEGLMLFEISGVARFRFIFLFFKGIFPSWSDNALSRATWLGYVSFYPATNNSLGLQKPAVFEVTEQPACFPCRVFNKNSSLLLF